MKLRLSDIAHMGRRPARRHRRRSSTASRPTRARSRRARCSSRCKRRALRRARLRRRPRASAAPRPRWSSAIVDARHAAGRRRRYAGRARRAGPRGACAARRARRRHHRLERQDDGEDADRVDPRQRHGRTHVNAGNLNNEIGVPLTLLAMPETPQFAVHRNGRRQARRHRVSRAHRAARRRRSSTTSRRRISNAWAASAASPRPRARSMRRCRRTASRSSTPTMRFAGYFAELAGAAPRRALRPRCEGRCARRHIDARQRLHAAHAGTARRRVALPLPGRHNVMNALAAAAIAIALDVPLATIRAGLEAAPAVAGRLVRRKHASGAVLIDDSYNANPGSFAAAIATLAAEPGRDDCWCWATWPSSAPMPSGCTPTSARSRKASGIQRLHAVGRLSRAAVEAFGSGATHHADAGGADRGAARRSARRRDAAGQGSRSSAMDRVVSALLDDGNGGERHAA